MTRSSPSTASSRTTRRRLIQDFPADYLWVGTKIAIAKQIGNAVPSGLARAIARQVKPFIS